MVTSINLGNFSTQNGRNVISGSSSGGIDTEALIESLTKARRLPADQLETRIEKNGDISAAYSELENLLKRFQGNVDLLRNPPGVLNDDENIFEYRGATVGGNVSGAASNYLSVTAEPGADISSYDITVDQLASYNTKITNTFALADADTDAVGAGLPFNAGTLTLGANAVDIEIEAGDTLNQIVAKINAVSNQSRVRASIIQVDDGQYRLSLKTTRTGTDYNYDLGIPTPPSFLQNEAIFRLDAQDINGDGDYANNPGADQPVAAPTDASGTTTIAASGGNPQLDVDGATNGLATLDFSAGNVAYEPANANEINAGGPYSEKAFAFSFRTGAGVAGTQTIYEQGGASRSFGLYIAEDPGNGNQPTLFAVAHNDNEWAGGDQLKVLNLGTVSANTDYNVVLDFDATANPAANDAANTFTGYVDGVQVAQETAVAEMAAHNGAIAIGASLGGDTLPDGTNNGGDGNYFSGQINEIALLNRSVSSAEVAEINTYFDRKFSQPVATSAIFNVGFAVVEDASDAQMTIDGTTVVRSTNNIDDVIDGLSFNLLSETGTGEELTVNLNADTELAKSAIMSFVDSYNELRIFAAEQNATADDGTPAEGAVLTNSSSLQTIVNRINSEVSAVVNGIASGNFDRLADIGLNFTDFEGDEETPFVRNIITVDEAELDSAIATRFDEVRSIFEFDFTTDDPDLTVFSRTNGLRVSEVDLTIDQTNGVYEATFTDPVAGLVTIALSAESTNSGNGVILTAPDDSALSGLTLIYANTDDATVNLNLTQGIADRIFNSLNDALNKQNGFLKTERDSLADTNQRLQEEISRIDDQIERYRERLIREFSALEEAIAQANIILQSIAAQNDARNAF